MVERHSTGAVGDASARTRPTNARGVVTSGLLLLVAASLLGCAGTGAVATPGFRRLALTSVQPDVRRLSVTLTVALTFRYVNPLSVAIPVPQHTVSLYLDGRPSPAVTVTKPAFTIPAQQSAFDVTYTLPLVLGGPGSLDAQYLGRDVPFRFAAAFALPGLPGAVPAQLQLVHDDSLRLPLFPELSVAGPPRLQLVGTIRTLDIAAFRDPMLDVGDVLVRFLGPILDAYLVAGALVGGDEAALQDPGKRQAFTRGWTRFKEDIPDRILDLPASRLEGVRLEVPVRVRNPNRFEIQAPTATVLLEGSGATAAARRVALVALQYPGATGAVVRIPAGPGTVRDATLVAELRWTKLANGSMDPLRVLLALDGSGTEALTLHAEFALDLGYGPVSVPLDVPVQLRLNP